MLKTGHRTGLAALVAVVGVAVAAFAAGEPKVVEITPDVPRGVNQTFTARMTPSETRTYDTLAFECTYHQEYRQKRSDGREVTRVVEPASYTHQERDVKMVEDLDKYISFRVPIRLDEVRKAYGSMFNTNGPVTVSRIRISAEAQGQTLWSTNIPATAFRPEGARLN